MTSTAGDVSAAALEPNRSELRRFADALFRYADKGGFVQLRAFRDDIDGPWNSSEWQAVKLNGDGLEPLVAAAFEFAGRCSTATERVVFAPPVATFKTSGAAAEKDIFNGLVLSVECDQQAAAARQQLEALIGTATVVVESGGTWADPATGEVVPKLHLHWRLSQPTRDFRDHLRLKEARRLAKILTGADGTAVPLVHPLRWPGSWHRKGQPRLACIVAYNPDCEIDLVDTLDALHDAVDAVGHRRQTEQGVTAPSEPGADPLDIASALAVIPNDDVPWDEWNKIGMATWRASAGSESGFAAFAAWSAKSGKYSAAETRARWDHYPSSPPTEVGAGSLFYRARQYRPDWQKPTLLARGAGKNGAPSASALSIESPDSDPVRADGEPGGAISYAQPGPNRPPAESLANGKEPWFDLDESILNVQVIAAPPFPKNFLPAGWEDWTLNAAEGAGCASDYVVLPLLAAVAVLIGNARWGQPWQGWSEPPVLFVGLIGRPSSGKSPGLDTITGCLAQLETASNEDWDDRRRTYKRDAAAAKEERAVWESEIKEAIRNKKAPPDLPLRAEDSQPVQRRRLFSTAPTIEKAALLCHGNSRGLLLVRDELSGWIGGMDRYSHGKGNDRAFWLQAYGGRLWTPDRVKDGETEVIVPHLLWGICGGIQPDRVASQLLTGDDDGLAARFLFGWPAQTSPRRPRNAADQAVAVTAFRRFRELPWQPPEPVILPFAEDAAEVLQAVREEVADLERARRVCFNPGSANCQAFASSSLSFCSISIGAGREREIRRRGLKCGQSRRRPISSNNMPYRWPGAFLVKRRYRKPNVTRTGSLGGSSSKSRFPKSSMPEICVGWLTVREFRTLRGNRLP